MLDPELENLTPEEEERLLAEALKRFGARFGFKSLEDLLTSPDGFGITTATKLQRACCRIVQGVSLGELAEDSVVKGALGYAELPEMTHAPEEVIIVAGVRTAKSMLAAATAVWASQHADLSMLTAGEIARYTVVSLQLDNARVIHSHLLGALQKPALSPLRVADKDASKWREMIDETGLDVIGSEFLWHPSGRPVEIRVVAGKRAGGSAVSRWSIGMCLDEAARMVGQSEGVVNYDDMRKAVLSRLLPGATILSISSPWAASGPIYDVVTDHWGNPTKHRVVIKATGPAMNPYWWTPARCEYVREHDPIVYRTDVLAEFADATDQLIPQDVLKRSLSGGTDNKPYQPNQDYVAALDPATRKNAWTFVIFSRRGRKKQQVYAAEWQGTAMDPLRPREILKDIAEALKSYGLDWAYTDQWSAEALDDIAEFFQISLVAIDWTAKEKKEAFLSLLVAMQEGEVELLHLPNIEKDLKNVRRNSKGNGDVSIQFNKTPDGRHCDFAPPIARALKQWIEEDGTAAPVPGTKEYDEAMERAMLDADEKHFKKSDDDFVMEMKL